MEKKFNERSTGGSFFKRDRSADSSREERGSKRSEFSPSRREDGGERPERRSYNPNFTPDNRVKGSFERKDRNDDSRERRSFGADRPERREGGFQRREGGFEKREGGFQRRERSFDKPDGGFGRRDNGFEKRDNHFGNRERNGEERERRSFGSDRPERREGGFQRREGGFEKREGGFQRRKGGFEKREGGFQRRERSFDKPDGGFGRRDNGFEKRDNHFGNRERNGEERERRSFGSDRPERREGGFQRREGGFEKREGGFQRREGGFERREGGFQRREGGFERRERSFDKPDGGFGRRDNGFDRKESGFGERDRNSDRRRDAGHLESGFRRRDGGFQRHEDSYVKRDKSNAPKNDRIDGKYDNYDNGDLQESLNVETELLKGELRLNRYVSMSGVCSRREADTLIADGRVSVNGEVVTELGSKVTVEDIITVDGKVIKGEKNVYILMNKPKDFVTTMDDPNATNIVTELLGNYVKERVYPVGRLDKNSVGVLILTNDGDLTKILTHPSYNKKKIYHAFIDKDINDEDMEKLTSGIELEDGVTFADEVSCVEGNRREVGVEIHSGRNRVVRRMFEHLGYKVRKLDRVSFAGLTKKNLKRGEWRFLAPEEVAMLKQGVNI